MKKWMMLSLILIVLGGCQSALLGGGHPIIEWMNFIKWNGRDFYSIDSGVLADNQYLGEKVGKIKFKVADNVTNPSYKTKDGDAAFYEKGTEIFSIKGNNDLLAVKSENSINGYQLFYSTESTDYKWHFKHLPLDEVKKIEIYTQVNNKRIAEIVDNRGIEDFLEILNTSKVDKNFVPNTNNRDPISYAMVFYTDGPIAYNFNMQFDGNTYFWYPWDACILSDDIKEFIPEN
ncbi:metallophosphoesterase family protein [Viridibacillus arvi]|uniref:hypothetical protein n=1 Tax=Viridibacillus arvi TaxID=263475 RepID=UPI0036E4C64C